MDLKEIQELIKFVAKSGATEVELEVDNIKISIKSPAVKRGKLVEEPLPIIQQIPIQQGMAPIITEAVQPAPAAAPTPAEPTSNNTDEKNEDHLIVIKSPMIGTFYRKPSPDKDTFVNVGDTINPGDVTCVIEAMKLFNEIESEVSGKIVKVLVDDSSPVEYDQPLFLVDPS
jgi:acetyl-CoA carboxylase biotin carboxyl carrier protein